MFNDKNAKMKKILILIGITALIAGIAIYASFMLQSFIDAAVISILLLALLVVPVIIVWSIVKQSNDDAGYSSKTSKKHQSNMPETGRNDEIAGLVETIANMNEILGVSVKTADQAPKFAVIEDPGNVLLSQMVPQEALSAP